MLTACVMLGEMFGLVRGCTTCCTAQARLLERTMPRIAFLVENAQNALPAMTDLMRKCPMRRHCSWVLSRAQNW